MKGPEGGIPLLLFLPLVTRALSETETIKGSCGGRLETNVSYSGSYISQHRDTKNATGCSGICGQTDKCQYWTFSFGESSSYCRLLSSLTSKGPATDGRGKISGKRPCRENELSVTVGSKAVEADEGATVEITCSTDEEINTCIITTPGKTSLDARAPGATYADGSWIGLDPGSYADGRIQVLETGPDSCGLKITGVEQEDFGAWRCTITALKDGSRKQGFNTITIMRGLCGNHTEEGVRYAMLGANYLRTSLAATASVCADFCWELAECKYWTHNTDGRGSTECYLLPNIDIINRKPDTSVISGRKPCGKRGPKQGGNNNLWKKNSFPEDSCGTKEEGIRYSGASLSRTWVDPKHDSEACGNLCSQHGACQYWKHNSWDGECYLFSSLTNKYNNPTYTSGRRSCSALELSVRVNSSLVEVEEGGAAELWCSHNSTQTTTDSRQTTTKSWQTTTTDSRQTTTKSWQTTTTDSRWATTDSCTFTTPGNTTFVMASGAAYQGGRLEVLGGGENSWGLRIARVEEADLGLWRCSFTASVNGVKKEGANSINIVGSCGNLVEKTSFANFNNEHFTTYRNSTPLDCANLCSALSVCRYWSHTRPSSCKLFPKIDVINLNQGDNVTAGQKPCSKKVSATTSFHYAAIIGGAAAAIVIIIAAVSGWCLWSRRRKPRKPAEEPRELEVWQVGPSEESDEPENYYATMRPGTWKPSNKSQNEYDTMGTDEGAGPSNQSKAVDELTYIYETDDDTNQPESDNDGNYVYGN